jgi:hypothetical protein
MRIDRESLARLAQPRGPQGPTPECLEHAGRRQRVLLVAIGCVLAGCGATHAGPPRSLVALSPPSYRGVRLGDELARLRAVFGVGRPYDGQTGGGNPLGAATPDYSGPVTEGGPGTRAKPIALADEATQRYRGSSFALYRNHIYSILVIDPDSGFDPGLRIGAPIQAARDRFPTLQCTNDLTYEDSSPTTSACHGQIGPHLWIWIGGDPLASIEVSRYRLNA